MKKYLFICISILFLQITTVYGQSIYQTTYYKNPPQSALVDINDIKPVDDNSEKRIKSLKDPQKLIVLQNLGFAKQYLARNDLLSVYSCLDKVDNVLPDLSEALYLRALSHWAINDISFARYYFLKALSVGTDNYQIFEDAAKFFIEIGIYKEAIAVCIQAYKKSKDASWLFEGAEMALEFDEQSANYYFSYLSKLSYHGFGLEGLSDIAAKNGFYLEAQHGYSLVMKDYRDAKYQKLKLSKENIARVSEKINMLKINMVIADWSQKFENKEFDAALDILKTISHATAAESSIFLLNAKTYFEMGKYTEAQTLLNYSISQDNTLEEAFVLQAQIQMKQGQTNKALETIENGLKYNYDKMHLYDVFLDLLKTSGAIYYYNSILLELYEVSKLDNEQLLTLAQYYFEKKDYKKYIEILDSIEQTEDILLLKNRVDDTVLLEQSQNYIKDAKYKDIISNLYQKEFSNSIDENLRLRLVSQALYQLGDEYSAIQILVDKLNNETLSLENVYYLKYLISISKELGSGDVLKKLNDYEKKLSSSSNYLCEKIDEFLLLGQFDNAIAYLNRFRNNSNFNKKTIDNLEAKIYSQIAGKLYDERNISEAKNYMDLALSKNRDDIDAVYINKLLNVYSKWGDIKDYTLEDNYDITIAMADDFLLQIPARIDIRMIWIRALALDENREAVYIMKKLNGMDIYNYLKLSIFADTYYGFELYDHAIDFYNRSLKDTFNMYAQVMYIQTLAKLGRINDALKLTLSIRADNPNNSYIDYLLSKLYLSKGDIRMAFESINTAIRVNNNEKYQLQLGFCYEADNRSQMAFDIYADVLHKNKNYADAYVCLIKMLLENRKTLDILNRAKSLSETLITFDNSDAYYYYLLADSYYNIASFGDSVTLSDKIENLTISLQFFYDAMSRSVYGGDKELRVLIQNRIIIVEDNLSNIVNGS